MQTHGIPSEYTKWYKQHLQDRTTALTFDDFTSNVFQVLSGLDQGCPISLVFFPLYNTLLIKLADNNKDLLCLGFIDNTTFATWGETFEEANEC